MPVTPNFNRAFSPQELKSAVESEEVSAIVLELRGRSTGFVYNCSKIDTTPLEECSVRVLAAIHTARFLCVAAPPPEIVDLKLHRVLKSDE